MQLGDQYSGCIVFASRPGSVVSPAGKLIVFVLPYYPLPFSISAFSGSRPVLAHSFILCCGERVLRGNKRTELE
jgi:hypothetical protein